MNSIILTGASRGLGREIHDILAKEKSVSLDCTFISRKPMGEVGSVHKYIQFDFMDNGAFSSKISLVPKTKHVTFISNAGTIDPTVKGAEISVSEIEQALRINCTGPLAIAQQLAVQTNQIGVRLHIINISSGAASRPIEGWIAYCTSKAAAFMAMNVLALENDHVTVQHFDPGVMDTDMQSHIRRQPRELMPDVAQFQGFKKHNMLKSPREVAEILVASIRERFQ